MGRGRWWQVRRRRSTRIYAPVVLFHANPNGGPVLRGEASWRTVSGLQVRLGETAVWLLFRRPTPRPVRR